MASSALLPRHSTPTSHQGLADVVFTLQLVATSIYGCSDTASAPILVHPQPLAQFIPGVTEGCQPLTVHFQDLSIGAQHLAVVLR